MDVPSESNCSLLLLNEDMIGVIKKSRSGSVLSFPQSFCQSYILDLLEKWMYQTENGLIFQKCKGFLAGEGYTKYYKYAVATRSQGNVLKREDKGRSASNGDQD